MELGLDTTTVTASGSEETLTSEVTALTAAITGTGEVVASSRTGQGREGPDGDGSSWNMRRMAQWAKGSSRIAEK